MFTTPGFALPPFLCRRPSTPLLQLPTRPRKVARAITPDDVDGATAPLIPYTHLLPRTANLGDGDRHFLALTHSEIAFYRARDVWGLQAYFSQLPAQRVAVTNEKQPLRDG